METVIEILDRIEAVLRRYMDRLPPDARRAVEGEVLGLLRMARAQLPKELHQAARHLEEAEATLSRAREQARRMVADSQSHTRMVQNAGGSPTARSQAVIEEARREADRLRRGADEYAAEVLQRLEAEVDRILATIRRGQEALRTPGPRRVR